MDQYIKTLCYNCNKNEREYPYHLCHDCFSKAIKQLKNKKDSEQFELHIDRPNKDIYFLLENEKVSLEIQATNYSDKKALFDYYNYAFDAAATHTITITFFTYRQHNKKLDTILIINTFFIDENGIDMGSQGKSFYIKNKQKKETVINYLTKKYGLNLIVI